MTVAGTVDLIQLGAFVVSLFVFMRAYERDKRERYAQLKVVESKLDSIGARLGKAEESRRELFQRVGVAEAKVGHLGERLDATAKDVARHERRMDRHWNGGR